MKQIVFVLLLLSLLVSCGTRSGYFKVEGRLLNINQGELYVYSSDGAIDGMDTIKVEGGRFTYEIPSTYKSTLTIVFPNYYTQPIFTEPGESVTLKANASHLKELEITGTDDNELMTDFRKQIASASPPDQLKYATRFIKDHPNSLASLYILKKYFILTNTTNYQLAIKLLNIISKAQPENGEIKMLNQKLAILSHGSIGNKLKDFSFKCIDGNIISSKNFKTKEVIVNVWATWNYDSRNLQLVLNDIAKKSNKIEVIGICIDASRKTALESLKNDMITFPNICDGEMMEGNAIKFFGFRTIPDNLVIKNGKIVERRVSVDTFRQRLNNLH